MFPDFDPVEARQRYKIGKSCFYNILKEKEKILNPAADCISGDRKSIRLGAHDKMEEALYEWLCKQNGEGLPVTVDSLTDKAHQILPNFNPQSNWIYRFRKRYNVAYNKSAKIFQAVKKDQ